MQNNRKLLFFDIDKTLLTPYPWAVPASARIALKKAHDNGHLLFVNSGRTYAMIPEIIRKIGFDGYVCGCGSQIYMNGELLFSSSIPNSLCREIIERSPHFLSVRTKFYMITDPVLFLVLSRI